MREFIKKLLILLSTPFYLIAASLMCILWISRKIGDGLLNHINEWIEFMESDYKKIYEMIKHKK